jgi:hypothetical protein
VFELYYGIELCAFMCLIVHVHNMYVDIVKMVICVMVIVIGT